MKPHRAALPPWRFEQRTGFQQSDAPGFMVCTSRLVCSKDMARLMPLPPMPSAPTLAIAMPAGTAPSAASGLFAAVDPAAFYLDGPTASPGFAERQRCRPATPAMANGWLGP